MNVKTSLSMIATITVLGLAGMSQAYQATERSVQELSVQQDRTFSLGKSLTQGMGLNNQQHLPLISKRKKKRIVVAFPTVSSDTVKTPASDNRLWLS